MKKIDWCLKQSHGLKLIEPSLAISQGYLKMAEDSIGTMNREKDKNLVFGVSAGYYSIYYSIYAIIQRLGFKSEIHSCSVEFMKEFLCEFYSQEDFDLIEIAFLLRNTLQYYVGRNVNKNDLARIWEGAYLFFVKSRDILVKINEQKVQEIRNKFKEDFK